MGGQLLSTEKREGGVVSTSKALESLCNLHLVADKCSMEVMLKGEDNEGGGGENAEGFGCWLCAAACDWFLLGPAEPPRLTLAPAMG